MPELTKNVIRLGRTGGRTDSNYRKASLLKASRISGNRETTDKSTLKETNPLAKKIIDVLMAN